MALSLKNQSLFLIALRVLTQFNEGLHPSPEDISVLQRSGLPDQETLHVDELACAVIQRALTADSV